MDLFNGFCLQSSSNSWHCLPSPVPPISSVCLPPSAPPTISSSCMMTQTTVKSSASNTTWTTPTPKPPLRARSRSRSSSRGNSPSIQSPQLGRSPSRGQSSPHPSPVRCVHFIISTFIYIHIIRMHPLKL